MGSHFWRIRASIFHSVWRCEKTYKSSAILAMLTGTDTEHIARMSITSLDNKHPFDQTLF
jgi:hypothetical protein